jgi:DNA polymerase-3 subunit epsilon
MSGSYHKCRKYRWNRELVFDVETTGLTTKLGNRIVEIAVVELINGKPSGHEFHRYVDPERPVRGSYKFHGLKDSFLKRQPYFETVCYDLLNFIRDSTIIAHNASFDMRFLKYELELVGIDMPSNDIVDTLKLARKHFGRKTNNTLGGLCTRYGLAGRPTRYHSAIEDARLLANVYYNLLNEDS